MKKNNEILEYYEENFKNFMSIDFKEIGIFISKLEGINYEDFKNKVHKNLTDYMDCSNFFIIFLIFFIKNFRLYE
jgi:hypothetical protein